jgi:hypothetical protein
LLKSQEIYSENVKLTWERPLSDGGSDITNYVIERGEVNQSGSVTSWTRSGISRSTAHWVEYLESNHKYQFRVMAENLQGRSVPSEPSEIIITKETEAERKRKNLDADGNRIRGKNGPIPSDYDKCCMNLSQSIFFF